MARRGIFFISILFISILVCMFITAAIELAPSALVRGTIDQRQQAADRAAKTGLAWCRTRLSQNPSWIAQAANVTSQPGLLISEGQGQVLGWIQEGPAWTRFRLRFNWQDGPGAVQPSTDGLDDPTTPWTDLPLVSCNNLAQMVSKNIPTSVILPSNSALLSIEGAAGTVTLDASGNPASFSGLTQTKSLEVILRISDNSQGVTPAAIQAAGDVNVNVITNMTLPATPSLVTRIRTKGNLQVEGGGSPDIVSSNADLCATSYSLPNGLSSNITQTPESPSTSFYAITPAMVRVPKAPLTPNAGVYVVKADTSITYYALDYSDYENAKVSGTLPSGTIVIPTGWQVASSGSNVSITFAKDVVAIPAGPATDFAIVSEAGNPTFNASLDYSMATTNIFNFFGIESSHLSVALPSKLDVWTYSAGQTSNDDSTAWGTIFPNLPGVKKIAGSYTWTDSKGNTTTFDSSNHVSTSAGWTSGSNLDVDTSLSEFSKAIALEMNPDHPTSAACLKQLNILQNSYSAPTLEEPTIPAIPSGILTAATLQINLIAPSGGSITCQTQGNMVMGGQLLGNGAALVAAKDIDLLGTSTDLNSQPGQAMGLNLYAQGNIYMNTFASPQASAAAQYHNLDMQGVVYSWGNVAAITGNQTIPQSQWGTTTLDGVMVAYGASPSGSIPPYTGQYSKGSVTFFGNHPVVQFDPNYLMGVYQTLPLPLPLRILSWHEH